MQKGAHELREWLEETGLDRVLWATDLDLTLSDKQVDALRAANNPELAALCQDINRLLQGRFYIITGRDLGSLDDILAPARIKASTEYHNRVRLDGGMSDDLNPLPQWELIDDAIDALIEQWPGMGVRQKPFMRTVYYNKTELMNDPEAREQVRQQFNALLDQLTEMTGQELTNTDGGHVFDMGPAAGDKEEAFACIYAHASRQHDGAQPLVPIYFGDSPGDLPAAKFAHENGGIFISVGDDPRVTAVADFQLSTPEECRALIRTMTQGLNPPASSTRAQPRRTGPRGP
jgi:trehalose-phosphatase